MKYSKAINESYCCLACLNNHVKNYKVGDFIAVLSRRCIHTIDSH